MEPRDAEVVERLLQLLCAAGDEGQLAPLLEERALKTIVGALNSGLAHFGIRHGGERVASAAAQVGVMMLMQEGGTA